MCKYCRSWKMLQNAYWLAKFVFDTAENEPSKSLQNSREWSENPDVFNYVNFAVRKPEVGPLGSVPDGHGLPAMLGLTSSGARMSVFGKFSANFRSFSAVSAPIFASKYAFCSIFQNLADYLAEMFEIKFWQILSNFADFATLENILLHFHENCWYFKPIFLIN